MFPGILSVRGVELWVLDAVSEVRCDGMEVFKVPGVDDLRFGFGGAGEQQGVADFAAGQATVSGFFDRAEIFLGI